MNPQEELKKLHEGWSNCNRCVLGKRREEFKLKQVYGTGALRGVMFISSSPNGDNEQTGSPVSGDDMLLLRGAVSKYKLDKYAYYTTISSCRSAEVATTKTGRPRTYTDKAGKVHVVWEDKPLATPTVLECKPRILQEIYLVDPLVIVTLGPQAANILLKNRSALSFIRGSVENLVVDGRSLIPVLTEKKKEWIRSYKGKEWKVVSSPRPVRYLCVPTYHPEYVMSTIQNESSGDGSKEFLDFISDIKLVADILAKYEEVIS